MSIDEICYEFGVRNYTINDDGSIDVKGGVNIPTSGLTEIPITFNKVSGTFYCQNSDLTTLKGSPRLVEGSFYCQKNKLTSLEGGPEHVGNSFYCYENQLTDLKGSPKFIGGDFRCDENNIFSLEGLDADGLSGDIYLNNNPMGSLFCVIDSDIVRAFNSYKVIKGNEINLKRLRYVMEIYDQPIYIADIKKYYTIK
tara:strand:+ start:144 stop:734 length:591 start_codon:yes stop_codon:yes gene_type:complete